MVEKIKNREFVRWAPITAWSVITLIFLAYFSTILRLDFAQMLVACQGSDCNFLALSTAEISVLHSWGLSVRMYAYFMSAVIVFVTSVYWLLGGMIAWQQGRTPVGLAVSLALIIIPISTFGGSTDWASNYPHLVLPGIFLNVFGTVVILVFFYLLPNGRFSPRWANIPLVITCLLIVVLTFQINSVIVLTEVQSVILGTAIIGLVIMGGIFQIYRYRHDSTPLERQQVKWILFGVLMFILGVIVWVLVFGKALEIPPGQPRLLAMLIAWSSDIFTLLGLPAAITIAILRYRLWDIDLVIRKTLQYTLLTAILALLYFGSITLLQSISTAAFGLQSPVMVVISTLAIAALFSPLRIRIQAFVDRRFFRSKYDAEQALAEFAAAARTETDPEQISAYLAHTVQQTLQPKQVAIWISSIGKSSSERRNP